MYDRLRVGLPFKYGRGLFFPLDKKMNSMGESKNSQSFFSLPFYESSHYAAMKFLEALRLKQIDNAMAYISKNYMDRIDLGLLTSEFSGGIKVCANVVYEKCGGKTPKNCSDNTFLLVDDKGKNTKVFHIYMLAEPDHLGKWKVYGIEQE